MTCGLVILAFCNGSNLQVSKLKVGKKRRAPLLSNYFNNESSLAVLDPFLDPLSGIQEKEQIPCLQKDPGSVCGTSTRRISGSWKRLWKEVGIPGLG